MNHMYKAIDTTNHIKFEMCSCPKSPSRCANSLSCAMAT